MPAGSYYAVLFETNLLEMAKLKKKQPSIPSK